MPVSFKPHAAVEPLIDLPSDKPVGVVIPIVAGIGNAILAVPMVRQLKRSRPLAKITIIARNKPMADVFERLPEVEVVHVTGSGRKGAWLTMRLSRKGKFDLAIIPFPSNRPEYHLFQRFGKAKARLMHAYPAARMRSLAFLRGARRVPARRGLHDVVQNLQLLEALGIHTNPDEGPIFPLKPEDQLGADRLLQEANLRSKDRFLVMHAGSAQTPIARAKRWPAERYSMLLQAIKRVLGIPVVLVEGPDEEGVARSILQHLPNEKAADVRPVKLTGPLGESAALLKRARAYVGSDSGLAHLSGAVGTPPVTLFAPADPDRVCPFGYRQLVIAPDKLCSPCVTYPWESCKVRARCVEPYCISEITVERVMQKLKTALESRKD